LYYSDLGGMTRTELEVIQSAELIFLWAAGTFLSGGDPIC
jgi:hypothetical protein